MHPSLIKSERLKWVNICLIKQNDRSMTKQYIFYILIELNPKQTRNSKIKYGRMSITLNLVGFSCLVKTFHTTTSHKSCKKENHIHLG